MECIAAFFILLFVFLFFLLVVSQGAGLFSSYEVLFRQLAARMGGKFQAATWFKPCAMFTTYNGVWVHTKLEHVKGNTWLLIQIHAPYLPVNMLIAPADIPPNAPLVKAMSHLPQQTKFSQIESGNYLVSYDSEINSRIYLNPSVTEQLQNLCNEVGRSQLVFTLTPKYMAVAKRWTTGLITIDAIHDFLLRTLRVHDLHMLSRESGIAFDSNTTTDATEQVIKCAICGEELGTNFVRCRRCKAPHHAECWTYNETCGMYACKETRYEGTMPIDTQPWYRRYFGTTSEE
jgi:Prokaryotic RING finger family 1